MRNGLFVKKRLAMSIVAAFLVIFLIVLLRSKGDAPIPGFAASEIVGRWKYSAGVHVSVIIQFFADGTFYQRIVFDSNKDDITQNGTWRIEQDHLWLNDLLIFYGDHWSKATDFWKLKKSSESSKVQIIGGAFPDPDVFEPLRNLGTTLP